MSQPSLTSTFIDHIPALYAEPAARRAGVQLVLWLPAMGKTKEDVGSSLQKLADAGFVAVSFDAWQHGERGTETGDDLVKRVFTNFRYHAWPILGHTVQDTLRVIDWAVRTFAVDPRLYMGGFSMGGDVSVAVAGIDHRVERVASVVGTPDWLRPDMHDVEDQSKKVPPGTPDAYAQYFYDQLNPLTHLQRYAHHPRLLFECGGEDRHIPASDAQRFEAALRSFNPAAADQVQINIEPGLKHLDFNAEVFWERSLAWFTA